MAEKIRRRERTEAARRRAAGARARSFGRLSVLMGVLLTVFTAYTFYAAFPGRGEGLPLNDSVGRSLNRLLPQGWAFFTKNPNAVDYLVYRRSGGSWSATTDGPLATPRNGWGFNRSPRFRDQQVQNLVAGLGARYWHECDVDTPLSSAESCLAQDPAGLRVANTWPVPVLCGVIGIVAARPLTWDMARSQGPAFAAARVLTVDLQC